MSGGARVVSVAKEDSLRGVREVRLRVEARRLRRGRLAGLTKRKSSSVLAVVDVAFAAAAF